MFKRLMCFFRKIFKNRKSKLLNEGYEIRENNKTENFKTEIRYDEHIETKELLKEILNYKKDDSMSQEEINSIQNQIVEYIDILIKKIDKCKNDVAIKQIELKKIRFNK